MNLPLVQLRILGCLLEKEATTPDIYPLSLNALTAACNQVSNREPVMDSAASAATTVQARASDASAKMNEKAQELGSKVRNAVPTR